MIKYRIIDKPAFDVVGKKTWISGQNNDLFGQFWAECAQNGLIESLERISSQQTDTVTSSLILGVSCVQDDPSNRAFDFLIGIEKPASYPDDWQIQHVPASTWAVFECVGPVPDALVRSEMFAFLEWLPQSGYQHAKAPELEVYFGPERNQAGLQYCEFWLPITKQ